MESSTQAVGDDTENKPDDDIFDKKYQIMDYAC